MQDDRTDGAENGGPAPEGIPERPDPGAIPEAGLLGRIISAGGIVFAVGIVASVFIIMQEVILRYFFDAPTIWANETTVFICALAFIYGGLYCAARNSHIRVVLIYDAVHGRAKRILDVVISVICMLASGIFAWAAWQMVKRAVWAPDGSIHIQTSGSAWDPPFPGYLKIFLLVVLAVMSVQFLILAVNYLRGRAPQTGAR